MAQEKFNLFLPVDQPIKGVPELEDVIRNNVNVVTCSDIDLNPSVGADLQVAWWAGHSQSPIADYLTAGKLPNLKLIVLYGVGYNHLPFSLLKEKNVRVANTPEVLSEGTAEMALTLMLASARRLIKGETVGSVSA